MPRRRPHPGPITLNGQPIDDMQPEEIVAACLADGHRIWGINAHRRNSELLEIFGNQRELSAREVVERYRTLRREDVFSVSFDAKRAGEAIRWGIDERLVEVAPGQELRFRLLVAEMVYERFGIDGDTIVRIKHLPDAAAQQQADRLWHKELQRRERLRVKRVKKAQAECIRELDIIAREQPDRPLPDELAQFRIAGASTFAEVRDLIIDAFAGNISDADAWAITKTCRAESMRATRDANRAAEPPPELDPETDAALAELRL
jgi:hypothetical protein